MSLHVLLKSIYLILRRVVCGYKLLDDFTDLQPAAVYVWG